MTTYGYLTGLVAETRDVSTVQRTLNAFEKNWSGVQDSSKHELLFRLTDKVIKHNVPHQLIAKKWKFVTGSDLETWCKFVQERNFLKSASDEIPQENRCIPDFECPDLTLMIYFLTLYVIFITFVQSIFFYY